MTPEQFDEFYHASARRLTGQLFALTGSMAEAEDVVQDAFVKAWQQRAELDVVRSPEAWVRTVAWRLAVSRHRRVGIGSRAWGRYDLRAVAAPDEPFDPVLVAALLKLPAAQRHAVVLHHVVDLSVEDVAREAGCPVGTVKARLSRGQLSRRCSPQVRSTRRKERPHERPRSRPGRAAPEGALPAGGGLRRSCRA